MIGQSLPTNKIRQSLDATFSYMLTLMETKKDQKNTKQANILPSFDEEEISCEWQGSWQLKKTKENKVKPH